MEVMSEENQPYGSALAASDKDKPIRYKNQGTVNNGK